MNKHIDLPVRLRCQTCDTGEMAFIQNLCIAIRAGWDNISAVPEYERPLPHRWGTHIGTCPTCLNLAKETAEPSSRRSGLMRLFRIAS